MVMKRTRFEQVFGTDWTNALKGAIGSKSFIEFDKWLLKQDILLDKLCEHEAIQVWDDHYCRGLGSLEEFIDSQYALESTLSNKPSLKKLYKVVKKTNSFILKVVDKLPKSSYHI